MKPKHTIHDSWSAPGYRHGTLSIDGKEIEFTPAQVLYIWTFFGAVMATAWLHSPPLDVGEGERPPLELDPQIQSWKGDFHAAIHILPPTEPANRTPEHTVSRLAHTLGYRAASLTIDGAPVEFTAQQVRDTWQFMGDILGLAWANHSPLDIQPNELPPADLAPWIQKWKIIRERSERRSW